MSIKCAVKGWGRSSTLMNSLLARLTSGSLVRAARVAAVLLIVALMVGYAENVLTVETAGMGGFGLAVLLLLAFPEQRASELLGAVAIWVTTAEFMSAAQTGTFQHWRWAVAVAALALVLVPLRVEYLRRLARTAPDRAIGELDRRAFAVGALPHTPAALATMRGQAEGPAIKA